MYYLKKVLNNPFVIIIYWLNHSRIARRLGDETYLKIYHFCYFRNKLRLENPQTFNEKLQWLKLNDRQDIYTQMADKIEVKKLVANKIGGGKLIPTIRVYDSVESVRIDDLPDRFVIKCSHDSGSTVICRNKSLFNWEKEKAKLKKFLKINYYYLSREWPYKNIKPRILVEEYMEQKGSTDLTDYKFYCFNGSPQFLYVSKDLTNHHAAKISFLNLDWTFADFYRTDYAPFSELPEKPSNFDEMLELCRVLCNGFKFIRVDFYSINGNTYFSEFTLYPNGAFCKFSPVSADLELGKLLKIED